MAVWVKVSKKHQIAVPSAVRKQLGIKSGDVLLVELRDGYAVLLPEPQDYSQRLRGLHREIWEGVEPQEYVRQEREAWQTELPPSAGTSASESTPQSSSTTSKARRISRDSPGWPWTSWLEAPSRV